jgi:N-methylhydantoinase A
VADADQSVSFQVDVRYYGQVMSLSIDVALADFEREGLAAVARRFDELHTQLYTFALDIEAELVSLRANVQGPESQVRAEQLPKGGADASAAVIEESSVYVDGAMRAAKIYDRTKLAAGNRIEGPAVIAQMDSTTLILPGHTGEIDAVGNILIQPNT